jgi:glutaredoxin-like protein NrdH
VKAGPDPEEEPMAVKVYALSTCPYCKLTKEFLVENDVDFDAVDVDLLEGEERASSIAIVKELSGGTSFPVVDIDGQAVVGFNKSQLEKLLGL